LNPGEEALDNPAALVATQPPPVFGLALDAVGLVRGDHLHALRTQLLIERIAVVRFIADQVLRLCLDHVEVKGQLHERDFMMVRGVRSHRQRQAVTIDNRHDFHAFSASRRSNLIPTALGRGKRGIDVALGLVQLPLIAKSIGQIRERRANHFVLPPLLKAPVHCLLVRVGLRKHAPLSASIENPQRRLE